ncbi:MAG TPA: hydroxymethylbilane synthase [Flavisolibacter sp.]
MNRILRIGTRDSQLALWQATTVEQLLKGAGYATELVAMKSEGDIDTVTPLYELGVQGVFTKTLDAALLNNRIDIAVHSMKDMPTRLARGIRQAAVLTRASYKDILVYKGDRKNVEEALDKNSDSTELPFTVATSSIRRMAQWLHRYPHHQIENLRGNVNTRLRKVAESNWNGAIFAAAGLERIHLRPEASIDLDWMLPAPSQGAIIIVCREEDGESFEACQGFNDEATALCTGIEKDFLRVLMGGCSTPISALAEVKGDQVYFRGSICSTDGIQMIEVAKEVEVGQSQNLGVEMAHQLLQNEEAQHIINTIRNGKN